MKRIFALFAAAVMTVSLTACSGSTATLPELTLETKTVSGLSSGEEAETEIVREAPDASKYDDSLVGLMTYMEDGKAVVRDSDVATFQEDEVVIAETSSASFVQTSFKEIGALNGYRYRFTYSQSTVQAEFYEFDPEDLDEKAQACVESVEEKGFFTLLEEQIQAVLHPSGKYMMIYIDQAAEKLDSNREQKEWAEKLFLEFPAE